MSPNPNLIRRLLWSCFAIVCVMGLASSADADATPDADAAPLVSDPRSSTSPVTADATPDAAPLVSDPRSSTSPVTGVTTDPKVPPPGPSINPDDPQETIAAIVTFWRSGKGLVALGFTLVLIVWAVRKVIGPKIAWLATRAGGYTLNFGTSAILVVGGGLVGGVELTANLIGSAVAAGLAAAGAWNAAQDLKASAQARSVVNASAR